MIDASIFGRSSDSPLWAREKIMVKAANNFNGFKNFINFSKLSSPLQVICADTNTNNKIKALYSLTLQAGFFN